MSPAFFFICLSLVQACVAPAVVSDVTSNPASSILDTSFSFASSDSPPNTCNELDKCRSLVSIVTSCLATIFACIWVAVHPNGLLVAAGEQASQVFRKNKSFRQRLRYAIYQNNNTENTTDSLLDYQLSELAAREQQFVLFCNPTSDHTGDMSKVTRAGLDDKLERTKLACRQYLDATEVGPEDLVLANAVLWKVEHDLGRTNESWTTSHGFLAIMGGFCVYQNGKPMFPLQVDVVGGLDDDDEDISHCILELVRSRSLVPPTSDELGDRSKSDTLSKTIAVLQTLWFVAQCIARRIGNLAITNLEIMTLAYTVITVAMYAAWWHKPLNVGCPIRVKGDARIVKHTRPFTWSDILDYVTGDQDAWVTLRVEERVPTFWSSCSSMKSGKLPLYADIIALTVAMVFGAVHCAAWSYVLPSLAEQLMWRVCAIAITAIPLPMAAVFAVANPFGALPGYIIVFCMAFGALLYVSARILLLVLSFTTLRHLPLSAFQTVQWTTWIPHI